MAIKKFEVGKTYENDGIEILITKRTPKMIYFKYIKENWWEDRIDKEYRKNFTTCKGRCETINLENHYAAPYIDAK